MKKKKKMDEPLPNILFQMTLSVWDDFGEFPSADATWPRAAYKLPERSLSRSTKSQPSEVTKHTKEKENGKLFIEYDEDLYVWKTTGGGGRLVSITLSR